jgi:hypothetical protein
MRTLNSCARKRWGDHLKDLARWVANGELERLGARGKRVTAETVRFSGAVSRGSPKEDYACLYWYLRNQVYFDLNSIWTRACRSCSTRMQPESGKGLSQDLRLPRLSL